MLNINNQSIVNWDLASKWDSLWLINFEHKISWIAWSSAHFGYLCLKILSQNLKISEVGAVNFFVTILLERSHKLLSKMNESRRKYKLFKLVIDCWYIWTLHYGSTVSMLKNVWTMTEKIEHGRRKKSAGLKYRSHIIFLSVIRLINSRGKGRVL